MNVTFETKHGNRAGTHDWITPPEIVKALGEFDLDPCASLSQFYSTAKTMFTVKDDGLSKDWFGRVWCNPPYGEHTDEWLRRCKEHGNCIALIFARTETKQFFKYIWGGASAIMFLQGRISFYKPTGERGQSAGAPSVLVAFGENNIPYLYSSGIKGKILRIGAEVEDEIR